MRLRPDRGRNRDRGHVDVADGHDDAENARRADSSVWGSALFLEEV